MKGVGRSMLLSMSTLMILGCQGCEAVPVLQSYAPVNRFEVREGEARPRPVIDTSATISLVQGQTGTASSIGAYPSLAITPDLAQQNLTLKAEPVSDLSAVRFSNSPAIVDFEGRRNAAGLSSPSRQIRDFDATLAFSAADVDTGLGFDVAAVPRISMREDGSFEQRRVGGEIRIGQNFDQRGEYVDAKSWYLFAGADGEALVYEPLRERDLTESMALRDQVTVGDMQAGVSFTRGPGQVSLSYIHREVEFNERGGGGNVVGRESEDFAGISFTIRR